MGKYSNGNYFGGKIWIRRVVQPYCDICKTTYESEWGPAYPIRLIFASMRRNGWVLGKKCICPDCRKAGNDNRIGDGA